MKELLTEPPWDDDSNCHFCRKKPNQGYARREDNTNKNGKYYPACFSCAAKPYPTVRANAA